MEHPLSLIGEHASHSPPPSGDGPKIAFAAHRWQSFDRREAIAEWDALAQWAVEPNPFYESWYLLPSLKAFDPAGDVQLLVLTAGGQLAGLMPIKREARYYGHPVPHLRNWVHANCFLGQPLVAQGFERLFWREMLSWCDRQGGLSLFLHLAHCPLEGPLHLALQAELAQQARPAATVLSEERAMLQTDLLPEAYLEASLAGKKRKELRRQQRRLTEEGDLQIERLQDAVGVAEWVAEFLALEQRGWKGAAGSALACDTRTADLFGDALGGAARRGRLERLALRLDGRPIAMLANFLTPPGAFSYKTAFDEDYSRFSPGVLLQCENLSLLEQPGTAWVDSCASADHPMIDHFWRERRGIARHSLAIGGPLRRSLFSLLCRHETGASPGGIA